MQLPYIQTLKEGIPLWGYYIEGYTKTVVMTWGKDQAGYIACSIWKGSWYNCDVEIIFIHV